MCSEGTPQREFRARCPRHGDYAAFLQNAGLFCLVNSQGSHPGLVSDAPSGHGIANSVRPQNWERVDIDVERNRNEPKNTFGDTFGETFGAATGVSDPRLQKNLGHQATFPLPPQVSALPLHLLPGRHALRDRQKKAAPDFSGAAQAAAAKHLTNTDVFPENTS